MSTRSRIGIKNSDGTVKSIYCHHDGYPSHVGKILVEHYLDKSKVEQLLELGDMSSLGFEPISNPRAWEDDYGSPLDGDSWAKHWHEQHPESMCDTYKTRGEDCPAIDSADTEEYIKDAAESWCDFVYLYDYNTWLVFPLFGNNPKWKPVIKALEEEN